MKNEANNYALVGGVVGASLFTLLTEYESSHIPSYLVSAMGLFSIVFFFFDRERFYPLINFWAYAQLPVITRTITTVFGEGVTVEETKTILSAAQAFTLNFGLTLGNEQRGLFLGINFVPLVYLILFKFLRTSALKGHRVVITDFKSDNRLGDVFPIKGVVDRTTKLEKENHWLLIELDAPLTYDDTDYLHLLIRSKDEQILTPGQQEYICFLRLVADPSKISDKEAQKDDFPFIDWGMVQVEK